jgi:hypothetical protein
MYSGLRRIMLKVAYPFNLIIGEIHLPRRRFAVTDADYALARPHLKPGMVLLSYIAGHMTNLFIKGPVKHAAIVRDDEIIIEAVGKGVTIDTLENFFATKDLVVALRPTNLSDDEMREASIYAFDIAKRPADHRRYDYFFDDGDGAFYCAELVVYAWNKVLKRLGRKPQFVNRKIMGAVTTLPTDFLDAIRKGKMEIVSAVGEVERIRNYLPEMALAPSFNIGNAISQQTSEPHQ